MEYLTSNEIAIKGDISTRRVKKLCSEGRVIGVVQKGNLWLIPNTTLKLEEFRRDRKGKYDAMKKFHLIKRRLFLWQSIINLIIIMHLCHSTRCVRMIV